MLYVGLAVNGPLVAVLVAVFARVKIANPDGDCFRKFVTALELLLLAQFLEVGGLCILLLGLDGKERVVVKYAVDKEGVPRPLHLDIEKTVVLRMGENVQSDSTPFGNPELNVALELELEIVDLATLLKVKDRVEKIRENQLVVKELAEGLIFDIYKSLGDFGVYELDENRWLSYRKLPYHSRNCVLYNLTTENALALRCLSWDNLILECRRQ